MLGLLRRRSFGSLTLTQFLGAFNDNAFKQLVLLLTVSAATADAVPWIAESSLAVDAEGDHRQWLPATLFALPFVILCCLTGALADRFSKSRIIKTANAMEVGVMGVACTALWLQSYGLLLTTVVLMACQSALFGPSKYGSIREMVPGRDMSRANAIIQTTTTLAILIGVGLAGFLADRFAGRLWIPGLFYVGFAALGFAASLPIERLEPKHPGRRLTWFMPAEMVRQWRVVRGNTILVVSIAGSAFYYFVGALLLLVVNEYGLHTLGLDNEATSLLMVPVVLGIAVGAVIAGRLSGDRIEGGLVPIGLFGMAGALFAVQLAPESANHVRVCLAALGLASGIFSLPIRTLCQVLPPHEARGSVLGFSQVFDFVGILLAGPAFLVMQKSGLGAPAMMVVVGLALLTGFAVSLFYSAHFAIRFLLWVFVHTVYRLRVRGEARIPERGGAVLVANHVSFVDALLVAAVAPRPVHFLMYRGFFELPLVGWFARKMGAIPVSSSDSRPDIEAALERAVEAARRGELVCVFAEGSITRTGQLMPFATGFRRVARAAEVPVVPIALDRLWGSIFSYSGGRVFSKLPRRIPRRVDVAIGEPQPPDVDAYHVRVRIQELVADCRRERRGRRGSLAWRFLRQARVQARRPAVVDGTGVDLTYRKLLVGALALRGALVRRLDDAPNVAVLLPPGAGGVLANVALTLDGRTTVNLNYTMENEDLAAMCERAGCTAVVTARRFLQALDRPSPLAEERTILLEDVKGDVTTGAKLRGLAWSFVPSVLLADRLAPRARGAEPASEDVATIIFSSGSTGVPKGVQLTHSNVLSNVQSVLQVVSLGPGDAVLGILPFFHSFGYTITLWATLLSGARGVYHPNPLEAKAVGDLSREHGVTVLVGTPTFYQAYLRRCAPEDFARVRLAWSGAQKLSQGLADAWEERFGSVLMEGYGCTEVAPVVSANLPTPPGTPPRHVGHRPGTIGRPVPGVAVRIVDPESGEELGEDEEGLIEVKGANVMRGYLDMPEKTAEVIRDGWYVTGDVGLVDGAGFLRITDRLSRFSKIGGEMVPHGRVEEALQSIAFELAGARPDAELEDEESVPEVAVTAVEDERKGEQLVVLYAGLPFPPTELAERLAQGDLPKLFQPKVGMYFAVEEIPKLGTGKVDLRGLRELAEACVRGGARV